MEKEDLVEKLNELLDDLMKNSRESRAESKRQKKAEIIGYALGEADAYLKCANKLAAILIEAERNG